MSIQDFFPNNTTWNIQEKEGQPSPLEESVMELVNALARPTFVFRVNSTKRMQGGHPADEITGDVKPYTIKQKRAFDAIIQRSAVEIDDIVRNYIRGNSDGEPRD